MNLRKKLEGSVLKSQNWLSLGGDIITEFYFLLSYILPGETFFQKKTHHIIVQLGSPHVTGQESGIP